MFNKYTARKFILAVVAIALIVINEMWQIGISKEAIQEIVKVVLGFIGAEGIKDIFAVAKKDPVAVFEVGGEKKNDEN